jgi:acyl-CoA synthetase (AMP-forming)/AMP-acid ligase II
VSGVGIVEGSTLWELLERRAAATPDLLMLADEHDREVTWSQFRDEAERVAAGLFDLGIGQGSVVSWQLPTRIATVTVSFALSRLGAVQNPIIHLYREREVGSLVTTTGATWSVHPGVWRGFDYGAMGATIAERQPLTLLDVSAGPPTGDPAGLPPAPSDGNTMRWLYATSGTTSEPKAVCHTDGTLIAGGIGIAEALQTTPPDIHSLAFPYAHIGGPDQIVMALRTGIATILVEAFVPSETFALFARRGATHLGGGPAFYLALLAEQQRMGGADPIPTLREISGGGAPKPPELYWRAKERLGAIIRHGYGMTECPMIACGAQGDTDEQLAHSDGAPVLGCEILVVGADEQPVPAGIDGDILVRGPMLAKGYLHPEQTRESFRDDGFFRTGDRGHVRPDGHLAITGRSKDLIIRKGENISPREIEDVLMTHPSVGAVAVIGLPDAERGERVCAVVEPAVGSAPLTFAEVAQHCRDAGLMMQKLPEQVEFVETLPRNPTMKILKRVLIERFSDADAHEGSTT